MGEEQFKEIIKRSMKIDRNATYEVYFDYKAHWIAVGFPYFLGLFGMVLAFALWLGDSVTTLTSCSLASLSFLIFLMGVFALVNGRIKLERKLLKIIAKGGNHGRRSKED
jgi:hypothetical protein